MVIVDKVKRGENDANRRSTVVVKGHGQENSENELGTFVFRDTRGPIRSLEQETGMQEKGTFMLGSTWWSCQIPTGYFLDSLFVKSFYMEF